MKTIRFVRWFKTLVQIAIILAGVLVLTEQAAFAASPHLPLLQPPAPVAPAAAGDSVVANLGKSLLTVIFGIGGVAAACGGAWAGVSLITGSAMQSSQAVSRALMAILGVAGGLVLVLSGPHLAAQVVDAMKGVSVAMPTMPTVN